MFLDFLVNKNNKETGKYVITCIIVRWYHETYLLFMLVYELSLL